MRHTISRRRFLGQSAAAGAAIAAPAFALEPPYAENTIGMAPSPNAGSDRSQLRIADPSRIKALQITDIHFYCSPAALKMDERTLDELPRLIDHAQPDVVLLTGDLWHDNPDGRGAEYMEFGIEQIEKLGVPWAFVWGNHDMLSDYAAGHDRLAAAKGSLYAGGATGGHYLVELVDGDGAVRWELPCLNSSDRGAGEAARQWLRGLHERRGESAVPALGVIHIPLQQYQDIWDQGISEGIKLESVASWQTEDETFDDWKQACALRGVICGHDHINNYTGMMDGVELIYGQATGHGGYGGDTIPKGARLYTLNAESGSFVSEVVFPDGTRWEAEDGWYTEDILDIPWDTVKKAKAERRKRLFGGQ